MADLSSVVNFLALDGPGSGANVTFDFRGPGFLSADVGVGVAVAIDLSTVDDTKLVSADVVEMEDSALFLSAFDI